MGCFVNFGADWLGPGASCSAIARAVVVGEIDGATRPRTSEMHRLLQLFEPDAVLTDNIWGYLWGKLGYGAMLFATALTNDSMAENFADPARFAVFDRLGREVMAVARARGVTPVGFNGFDPAAFMPEAPRSGIARIDRGARRIQPRDREDPFGHLARSRRAQAADRGRSADRHHRRARRRGRHRHAGDPHAGRADPRHRGGPPPDVVRHDAES